MNERIYKIYQVYLRFTNSKQTKSNELDLIKKDIGKDILNTKFKEEDTEKIDLSVYFDQDKK